MKSRAVRNTELYAGESIKQLYNTGTTDERQHLKSRGKPGFRGLGRTSNAYILDREALVDRKKNIRESLNCPTLIMQLDLCYKNIFYGR